MKTKVCTKCKIEKPLSEFYFIKKLNKHSSHCKKCCCNAEKIRYKPKIREYILEKYSEEGMKKCAYCGEFKPYSEYYEHKSRKNPDILVRLYNYCKTCCSKINSEQRKNHSILLKKRVEEGHDSYIKFLIKREVGIPEKSISNELIELKRALLFAKRLLNEKS